MPGRATVALVAGGIVYAFFAASCFRLAVVDDYDVGVSIGEGLFTALGAAALFVALARRRGRALIVVLGTIPLVGWFVATPWNSGPPFLVASLVVPAIAAVCFIGASFASGRVRASAVPDERNHT